MYQSYQALTARRAGLMLVGLGLLAVAMVTDIMTGPAMLGAGDVLAAIFVPDDADRTTNAIVRAIRLPMSVMALLVGVALGMAGALMQTLLGNPLASPYTLGFSAAAGFGAATVILTGVTLPLWPGMTTPAAAFLGALVATIMVYGFARIRGMSAEIMVLAGIATLFLFQSLQSMIQYLASPEVLQQIVFWLFGSMLKANWTNVPVTGAVILLATVLILPDLWKFTALRLGEERARSLGINVRQLRVKAFLVVALLTAGAVAFVGTIGFVGLVAPHIARMLVGDDQRFLLPMSAIAGGIIMVTASIASKSLSPGGVVPIGIVTAIIGVPFLFYLILNNRRNLW